MPKPTYFTSPTAIATRQAEVPAANFDNGLNPAASCAVGIGINEGVADLSGDPNEFTLEDQFEAARVPQMSSFIGVVPLNDGLEASGSGVEPVEISDGQDAEGLPTKAGNATLADLATGWVAVV